jgi:hypothetical protein
MENPISRSRFFRKAGIVLMLVSLISCAPTPMLQSPRVMAGFSIGLYGYYDVTQTHQEWDSIVTQGEPEGMVSTDTIRKFREWRDELITVNPFMLRWGFRDRVEIGGLLLFFPSLYYNGTIKCFVHEFGNPVYFKNVSFALFAGSEVVYWLSHLSTNGGCVGFIAASRHSTRNAEIEFIFQPSWYQHHQYYHTAGIVDGRMRGIQDNSGIIGTVFKSEKFNMELIAGGVYRHEISNEWAVAVASVQGSTWDYSYINRHVERYKQFSRWVPQAGIQVNFN